MRYWYASYQTLSGRYKWLEGVENDNFVNHVFMYKQIRDQRHVSTPVKKNIYSFRDPCLDSGLEKALSKRRSNGSGDQTHRLDNIVARSIDHRIVRPSLNKQMKQINIHQIRSKPAHVQTLQKRFLYSSQVSLLDTLCS